MSEFRDPRPTIRWLGWKVRMLFWLSLAAATAWLLWYMVVVPGRSYSGALPPLTAEEQRIAGNLRRHVAAIASREHNVFRPADLEAAAQYIEQTFAGFGYAVAAQRFESGPAEVRNLEVEVKGGARAAEIVLVGAHYDSVAGAVGANDNGSGVAAAIELARLLRDVKPARTLRFVAFVNLPSRALLHEVVASFRRHAEFPAEGVAAPAFVPGVDWSDHWSFWQEGWPALMVTDTAPYRYPHYHTMLDTPDRVDYERTARVVTGLHGMLRELAIAE